MKEGYMTTAEALEFLGMAPHTFEKYASKLGIRKLREGRCCYYRKEDIERLDTLLANRVPFLVQQLEKLTGGKVTISLPYNN